MAPATDVPTAARPAQRPQRRTWGTRRVLLFLDRRRDFAGHSLDVLGDSHVHCISHRGFVFGCCPTFEFTRLRRLAKPAVAGRVQRRVSPWPDNALVVELSAAMHARTLPEAMVQAQPLDAPPIERAPRTDEVFSAAFKR
jgi:hypothetical protein